MEYKPKIFIGSTTQVKNEGYPSQLYAALSNWAEPVIWGTSIFELSHITIEDLEQKLPDFDACVFFMTKDDVKQIGNTVAYTPRDNIILEIGLSIGMHGRSNTFLVVPKGDEADMHFPTDILGITFAFFNSTADLPSEFEKISHQIKKCIKVCSSKYYAPLTIDDLIRELDNRCKPITENQALLLAEIADIDHSLKNKISILGGAEKVGIVNIFPNRYSDIGGKSVKNWIQDELGRATTEKNTDISIMGISLGDYFLERGVMHNEFVKTLITTRNRNEGPKIRALIVDPKCEALKERAYWEVSPAFYENGKPLDFHKKENQKAYEDSTTYIETDGAARIAQRMYETCKPNLEVRYYSQAPTCFIFMTERYAFVENYTYASRGSCTPIIQIEKGKDLYNVYQKHFDNIWEMAKRIDTYCSEWAK